MGTQVPFQETVTSLTCIGTHIVYMNELGAIVDIDIRDKIPESVQNLTSLSFNPTTKVLQYLDENDVVQDVDISSVCSDFNYLPGTHTVVHNGVPHQLNCGQLGFNAQTCQLSYTNEKGHVTSYFLPQDQFVYDPSGCTVTILPAKGGDPVTFPVGATTDEVGLQMLEGKILEFTYKSKKCQVVMPNSVVGCQYNRNTNTLSLIYCDGTVDAKQFAKASLECTQLDDGTQIMVFNDGCGGTKMFNIPGVTVDLDGATLVADVLTLTYGGDGNNQVLTVPLCQIIATHCNATITAQYPGGGFDFVDNAGNTFEVRPCCSFHDLGLPYQEGGPNVPPNAAKPAGANDGDRLVVKFPPNADGEAALGYYTCVNNVWVEDFLCPLGSPVPPEVHIGSNQPDKADGFTVWFDPATCIVKFCDGADGWFEPRNVVCSPSAPACVKGGPTLWFDESTGCLHVQCFDSAGGCVWVSGSGALVNQVIQALCLKIGSGPEVPLTVDSDGKVVIALPADMDNIYCIQIGDTAPVFASAQPQVDGKFVFQLPAYPVEPETCIRIGGTDAVPIVPHLEGDKKFLDLPAYPVIPDFPEIPEDTNTLYQINLADGTSLNGSVGQDGVVTFTLPEYPEIPEAPDKVQHCHVRIDAASDVTSGALLDPAQLAALTADCPKVECNTVVLRFWNQEQHFTCTDGAWVHDYTIQIRGNTLFEEFDGTTIDLTNPPSLPSGDIGNISPAAKSRENYLIECFDNALCFWSCVNGAWSLNMCHQTKHPVLNCGETTPSTDGKQGEFWMDPATGCLNALCDGVWKATNGADAVNA